MKRLVLILRFAFLGSVMILWYQNCGNFRSVNFASNQSSNSDSQNGIPNPPPAGDFPVLTSWSGSFPAPKYAPDCLTNSNYTLCVTYKDPVTTFGSIFNPLYTPASATVEQDNRVLTYGLRVPNTSTFANNNFVLTVAAANKVVPRANGDWKYTYRGDTRGYVAQLNAFYWLNRQVTFMIERTGRFYFTGRRSAVRLREPTAADNAFFSETDDSLNFGDTNFFVAAAPRGDVALDIAVIAHESGHGNLVIASNRAQSSPTKETCNANGCFCVTVNGCFGAIHEGMADVHSFILFPDKGGALGSYFLNLAQGLRNVETTLSTKTALSLFNGTNPRGEVHEMGEVYAAIWYGVWKKAKTAGAEKDIETLFTAHLAALNGADDFLTAYTSIATLADTLFAAKSAQIKADFRTEYQRMGLTPP